MDSKKLLTVGVAALAILVCRPAPPAGAIETTTFTYTGKNFQEANVLETTTLDSITGSATFATSDITSHEGLTGATDYLQPTEISYQVSPEGIYSYPTTTSGLTNGELSEEFWFDAKGDIDTWSVIVYWGNGTNDVWMIQSYGPGEQPEFFPADEIEYSYTPPGLNIVDTVSDTFIQGKWTPNIAAVPEPSTALLLGLGLIFLAGLLRKSKRQILIA